VADAQVPQLAERRLAGLRLGTLGALALAPGAPGYLVVAVLRGAAAPLPALLVGALTGGLLVLLHLLTRRPVGRANLDAVQLGVCGALLLGFALLGWTSGDDAAPILAVIVTLPVITVLFSPCRPGLVLLLLPPTVGSLLVGRALAAGQLVALDPEELILALAFAAGGALGAQLARRTWLDLAAARSGLLAAERMSNLGRTTAGIAHELKTPLAAVQNQLLQLRALSAELAASVGHAQVTEADLREIAGELGATAAVAETAAARAMGFVASIREHARGGDAVKTRFKVSDRLAAATALLSYRVRHSPVALDTSAVDPDAALIGDPGRFDQIVTNLLCNAFDACEARGRGRVRVVTERRTDGLVIAIDDDGPGIAAELSLEVFEPLVTTKQESGGTGLGLAIARDLARSAFGGDLVLARTSPGARFELRCGRAASAGDSAPLPRVA
jgi:signal transduction histidine kinase